MIILHRRHNETKGTELKYHIQDRERDSDSNSRRGSRVSLEYKTMNSPLQKREFMKGVLSKKS